MDGRRKGDETKTETFQNLRNHCKVFLNLIRDKIEELKFLQKMRTRTNGIEANILAIGELSKISGETKFKKVNCIVLSKIVLELKHSIPILHVIFSQKVTKNRKFRNFFKFERK